MDEKTPGANAPENKPDTNVTEGTEEILASDGTPEVIDVTSTTTTDTAVVAETASQEVTATDGAQEEVAVTAAAPIAVETTDTTVTVQDAPEAGQAPTADAAAPAAAASTPAPDAPAATPGAPVPPPPTGQTPVPPAPPAASGQPSPTGALVCGILAIVFSGLPLVGIILGIVAIILAGKYFKAGGTQGTGKAARICGIIGLIFSVLAFVAYIAVGCMAVNMLDDYDTSGRYTGSSSSSSLSDDAEMTLEEEEAAAEAVTMRLEQIKDRDPEMIASIQAMAEESFEDEFSYLGVNATMSDCGIDPATYMDIMLKDFDYKFSSFEMTSSSSSTKGTATFLLTSMDMIDLTNNFDVAIDELNDAGGLSGTSAEKRQQVGRLVLDVLNETGLSHYNFFEIDMVNEDGVWVIDEDSWDDEIEYFFTLS